MFYLILFLFLFISYANLKNHFHLMVRIKDLAELTRTTEISESDISKIVSESFKRMFQSYAMAFNKKYKNHMIIRLIRVRETTHSRHDAENVVVGGIDADLGGVGALHRRVRQHQLERSIVNARKVA
jgi:hypothetical protein